jgi:hypothetical protein
VIITMQNRIEQDRMTVPFRVDIATAVPATGPVAL